MDFEQAANWRRNRVIDFETEQSIVEAEGGAFVNASGLRQREALAYLGAFLAVGAGVALAIDVAGGATGQGSRWGGFFIALVVAAGLGAAAWFFGRSEPVGDRATGVVAALGTLAFAVALTILVASIIDLGDSSVLVVGIGTMAASFAVWAWHHSAPTQIALHIAAWITIFGILWIVTSQRDFFILPDFQDTLVWGGVLFLALGAAWLALTRVGYFPQKSTGYFLGTLAAWTGTEMLVSHTSGLVVLELVFGAGLAAYGTYLSRSLVIALGSLILAGGVIRLLGELFDGLRSPATGAVVIGAGALLLAVAMRDRFGWQATSRGAPPAPADPVSPPQPPEDPGPTLDAP